MPVFMRHYHILYNLLNVLIGGFHYAIHLWSIWRRMVVLDLELHAEFCDHSIVQISTIVRDNPFGDAIPTYKIMLNKLDHNISCNRGKQGCSNPLGKIVNGDEDDTIPIRRSRPNLSNHINAPH